MRLLIATISMLLPIVVGAATMSDATAAFDAGRVDEARQIYGTLLEQEHDNASLLYNLGNCAYLKGDMGQAIAYYERARRLAPRDSDIVENLNFVRGQLSRSAVGNAETPVELIITLRDKLRPDEWLLLAAVAWLATWLIAGVLRLRKTRIHPSLGILLLVCAAALASAYFQQRDTYGAGQAVVIEDEAQLYDLPNNLDAPAKQTLKEGDYVSIAERRTDWSRVRIDDAEGWMPNSTLGVVW
jgi:tetratricopeptide (TPR) repeat protein